MIYSTRGDAPPARLGGWNSWQWALKNGVTLEEVRALLLHASIYAGVPASNAAFRWMRDVLGDELDKVKPA